MMRLVLGCARGKVKYRQNENRIVMDYKNESSKLIPVLSWNQLLQADDKQDMEISETDVQLTDRPIDFISVYVKEENDECETEFNDVEIITAAQHFCSIEIRETKGYVKSYKHKEFNINNDKNLENRKNIGFSNSNSDAMQSNEACNIGSILTDSICLDTLDSDTTNNQIKKQINQSSEVYESQSEETETSYNISTVATSNQFLESLSLDIKKENKQSDQKSNSDGIYMTEWLCDVNGDANLRLKVLKNDRQEVQIPTDIEATITPITICKDQTLDRNDSLEKEETKKHNLTKQTTKLKSSTLNDYEERLRKKAECMREKRRKLYENESEEQRVQRLAREAAKRREMRMYYETPEQRRKRLDAEAARKRQYRLYNETPDDRRKRLDREAERRRVKRLSLYASESPEQRRERLNRESAKRREARLNQYAKETEEERKERLRKDALRAREIRFTRSAVETEEERRRRLVKDALRKREVRMHGNHSVSNGFTELQTVRNFEELNNVQIKNNPDNQLGGHYLSNWMMWFQNTLAQPVHIGDQIFESRPQNSGWMHFPHNITFYSTNSDQTMFPDVSLTLENISTHFNWNSVNADLPN